MIENIRESKIVKWTIYLILALFVVGLLYGILETYFQERNRIILNTFKEDIQKQLNIKSYNSDFYNQISILTQEKDFDQAIKLTINRIETYPEDKPELINLIGNIYYQKNNLDSAILNYSEAIRFCDTLYDAYLNRGFAYLQQNKLDLAIKDCLFISDKNIESYYLLSKAYRKKGKISEANKYDSIYNKFQTDIIVRRDSCQKKILDILNNGAKNK